MKIKLIFILFLTALLTGCNEYPTYLYLMRHPDLLQDESLRCSTSDELSPDDITYCQVVAHAMTDLANMANIQQREPEKFGMLVMATETDYVNAGIAIQNAKKAIYTAKERLDEHALQVAEAQYQKAKELHDQKHDDIGVLFSILKAHSPE